ncbi:hypothetical protein WN944_027326 [Citrus x changshan-huyou]|uniref:Uncharacterized protein n=1 Tax=Citrus x changshan-huyou TaxID=2935761 RepID=A0AAP0LIB9_9ROSI
MWTLLAASEDPRLLGCAASFKAPLLKAVSWMADNPGKLFRSQSDVPHCWTFFSTAAYGKRNKVPQEIRGGSQKHVVQGMQYEKVMGRELTDVHMDKKSNGVVPNSNDASCDKVHVAPKISEDNVDAKDYKPEMQSQNSPSKSHGPANVRKSLTVPQPFALATEKRASGTTSRGGAETAVDSNNAQSPMPKKTSQVT